MAVTVMQVRTPRAMRSSSALTLAVTSGAVVPMGSVTLAVWSVCVRGDSGRMLRAVVGSVMLVIRAPPVNGPMTLSVAVLISEGEISAAQS